MLGTRVTSFAFGFACASGLTMYKLKEEIWSSHKILADQVRRPSLRRSTPKRPLPRARRPPRAREPHRTHRPPRAPADDRGEPWNRLVTVDDRLPLTLPRRPPPAPHAQQCASTEARLSKLEMAASKQ